MKRQKSLYWRIRANDMERAALDQLAEMEGLEPPEAMRYAIRLACKTLGLWPPKPQATPTPEARHDH